MAARYDWGSIRAEYEAGATQVGLAREYGVSPAAIRKRVRAEGWTRAAAALIGQAADARRTGKAAGGRPEKTACPMNRVEDAKAVVARRHKKEWERLSVLMESALIEEDPDKAKLAKLMAETIKIRQDGERKAWGIQDKIEAGVPGELVVTWKS